MKKIILSVSVIAFGLLSCKKDKSCDLNGSSFAGTYKVTALKYKADATTPEVDEYALLSACEKDDLVIFNTNNTVTFQDAGTVCVPPGDDTGIWSLIGSSLNLDGDTYTVAYFDCNSAALTLAGTAAGELTTISLARQ
ncbi:MAG: hypothetical protein ABI741_14590 [Ferruginibacter sp.]